MESMKVGSGIVDFGGPAVVMNKPMLVKVSNFSVSQHIHLEE